MKLKKTVKLALLLLVLACVAWLVMAYAVPGVKSLVMAQSILQNSPTYQKPVAERTTADWVVIGAKEEVAHWVRYDASYRKIAYPEGDVSPKVGACTDVVIRALRKAGYDLQQLIHEDIEQNFHVYAAANGLIQIDSNIDHRRVPNQIVFFKRHGLELPIQFNDETKATWQPGDIVFWKMSHGQNHTGVISDKVNKHGVPLVIHNQFITMEEDVLLHWQITGHYRYPKPGE